MVEENWATYKDKVERYFSFSIEEKRDLVIAIFFVGFIYSFRDWSVGNFLTKLIIAAIVILAHISVQRLHALRLGYKLEYKTWTYGVLGGLILCFLSNGKIVVPLYGGFDLHMMIKHRIGHFRYGINMVNLGLIGFTGPLTSLLVAYFFKIINIPLGSVFIQELVLMNLLIAAWTILPIPPLIDGSRIFFWSRMSYVFMLTVILSSAFLIWFTNNIFFILIGSIFLGGVMYIIYYLVYEETGYYY